MITEPLDKISLKTIEQLIADGVRENRSLDYKRELPERPEHLLDDACAFANTDGGDLVFGILESEGAPQGFAPLLIGNVDDELLRLQNIIINGLEPKLYGVRLRSVEQNGKIKAIIARIPQSWSRPHRVIKSGKFKIRHESRNDDMDITELRAAFHLSSSIPERIRKYRKERVFEIFSREAPQQLSPGIEVVVHAIPISAFIGAGMNDFVMPTRIKPMGANPPSTIIGKMNIDGSLAFIKHDEKNFYSYIQMFRNGIIESAVSIQLQDGKKRFPINFVEDEIQKSIRQSIELYRELNLVPPFFIFLSINNLRDTILTVGGPMDNFLAPLRNAPDRDEMLFPEIVIDDYPDSIDTLIKPLITMLWNGFGEMPPS